MALPPVSRAELLRLAGPAAASAVLNNAFRVIDQYAASALGTAAQAAIGSCTFVLIGAWALTALVAAGAGPLVARATGAGDDRLRARAFGAALTGSIVLGLVLTVGGLLGADALAAMLGLSGEVASNAAIFLRTLAAGAPLLALGPLVDAVLVAIGRTRAMFILQVLAALTNAALNPLFIHGFGLGVEGTALATLCARALTGGIGVYVLWRELRPEATDLLPAGTLLRIARVGLPVTINTMFYALVYFALLRYAISPLGPTVNAALGIGFSALEGFTYPMFLGVSLGVSSLVGRQLGAGQPEEARRAARLGVPLSVGLGLAATAAFWFGAEPLCALFTEDPAVLVAAVGYAKALSFSQLFVSLEALAEGVLQGSGDTRAVFWLSAPFNALRVPLAWALAFPLGFGAEGVWWAINFTSLLKVIAKGARVMQGRWVQAVV